jgi:hypothetical protein
VVRQRFHRTGFEAQLAETASSGNADEVNKHGPTHPATAGCFGRVHGLQLSVPLIELLQRTDSEELAIPAEAEEPDSRISQTIDIESVDVLRWAVQTGEAQMPLQQSTNVVSSRVVEGDLAFRQRSFPASRVPPTI